MKGLILPQSDEPIAVITQQVNEPEDKNTLFPKVQQALRKRRRLGETAFIWFLRLLSAYCLMFGLAWLVRMIGIYDGPLWRFDLMPTAWKLASLTMCLLFLFSSVGLWLLASWGIVVWFLTAIGEVFLYAAYADIFGFKPLAIISNLSIALLFIGFRIWQEFQRRAERDVTLR